MKKIKKYVKYYLIFFLVVFCFVSFLVFSNSSNKDLLMNDLEYIVNLNNDGSATITENWNIYISHTNTLFRNFEKGRGYDEITDVSVKDLKAGKVFTNINQEMYHVTTDYFYALPIKSGLFEIAWGSGMERSNGNKKYQIKYTVKNVVTKYEDVEEFYWKLLSSKNDIPVKNVKGTIYLPDKVKSLENLKVWGHGSLNGQIHIVDTNKIEFSIKNLEPKTMLEIRVATADKMFNDSIKIRNYRYLKTMINEEVVWANKTNADRQDTQKYWKIFYIFYALLFLFNVLKIIKYIKIKNKKNDELSINKLRYYRDIPREADSTPSEAGYLYNFDKNKLDDKSEQSSIVAATILNLAHKKIIKLNVVDKDVQIIFLNKKADLSDTEKPIYKLLLKASKNSQTLKVSELKKYAEDSYYDYSKLIQELYTSTELKLYKLKFIDKGAKKEYLKSKNAESYFQILKFLSEFFIIVFLIGLLPFYNVKYALAFGISSQSIFAGLLIFILPLIIIYLVKFYFQNKIQKKIAILTSSGANEKEQWTGLKSFLEDFSLLNEKKVPDLILWEKYLIYATVFGIAEKVIQQMKASYPEVFIKEYFDEDNENNIFTDYPLFYYATIDISFINVLDNIATSAYEIAQKQIAINSSSSSSGSGRWWRIFFWRTAAAVAGGRNGRKIKNNYFAKR